MTQARLCWFFLAFVAVAFAGEALALWHLRAPGVELPASIPETRSHR